MSVKEIAQEYTAAVLEGRFATAEFWRPGLPSGPGDTYRACGTSRQRAVSGEIGGRA